MAAQQLEGNIIFDPTILDMLLFSEPPTQQAVESPDNDFLMLAKYATPSCEVPLHDIMLSPDLEALGHAEMEPLLPSIPHVIHGPSHYDERELNLPALPPRPPTHGLHISRPPMRKGTLSYREAHIHSERQRRQGMASLFATLRSLLPMPNFKTDRCTMLSYVIEYVQNLDKKLQQLAKAKAELEAASETRARVRAQGASEGILGGEDDSNSGQRPQSQSMAGLQNFPFPLNVTVQFWSREDVFITLNCPKKRGLWPELLSLLQGDLQLDVQNVTLSTTSCFCVHSIYAKVLQANNHHEDSCNKLRATLVDFVAAQMGF